LDVGVLADAFLHVGEAIVTHSPDVVSFLHIRTQKAKVSRTGLMHALPQCLDFIRSKCEAGLRVCITCDDGTDHSVAVAIAASISMTFKDPSKATKDDVRRRLAIISRTHPDARPTRGSLKQVYNYLIGVSDTE
jgi:tRNA A64-2'-O-ribosylphosphate transferase